jgi:hypothetical protein
MKTYVRICILYGRFLFVMSNVLDKSCKENQNMNFLFNRVIAAIMWKKYGTERPQITI